jgi:hypothetical protein
MIPSVIRALEETFWVEEEMDEHEYGELEIVGIS